MLKHVKTKYGAVNFLENERPELTAQLALQMLERWGPVAAMENGYDEAGRQKMKLLTPKEVVDRAFGIAEEAIRMTRNKGLMYTIPDNDLPEYGEPL